jgi:hypothetical protein
MLSVVVYLNDLFVNLFLRKDETVWFAGSVRMRMRMGVSVAGWFIR